MRRHTDMMIPTNSGKTIPRLGFALLVALSATGCVWVDDTEDLKAFTREQQARPSGRIEPLPQFKPYESFVYEGSSLRDPFRSLVKSETNRTALTDDSVKPDTERRKEYLEEFSVDELTMVGVITEPGQSQLWALIRDPNNEVHRVHQGNFLGNDYGEVVEISERSLELVEIISNGRGGWMQRPRTLSLDKQD